MKSRKHEMSRQRSSLRVIAAGLVLLLGNFSPVTSAVAQSSPYPNDPQRCDNIGDEDECWYGEGICDCNRKCVKKYRLGDWVCHDAGRGDLYHLNCEALNRDDGDCGGGTPGEKCWGDYGIFDCNGNCTYSRVGDGRCDDKNPVSSLRAFLGGNLNCKALNYDGGDCGGPTGNRCRNQYINGEGIYDCVGKCVEKSRIGDGTCDNGSNGVNLGCPNLGYDGGDCR